MDLRYEEWPAADPELHGTVTAFWRVAGNGSRVPSSAVLPDGHVELVFNLGAPVGLAGPAYTGDQPERSVVGLLSRALRLEYRGPVDTFGVRFHPARGAGFFGHRAPALAEKLLPLANVCGALDLVLCQLLAKTRDLGAEAARAQLERLLVNQKRRALLDDLEVVRAVDRLASLQDPVTVVELAREAGISRRQLQRRFLSAVGMTPKRFVRVTRFGAVWQVATMQPHATWASLAAEHGFADQAHLVREFRSFGAEPPTHLFTREWYETTELSRASGPAQGVRFVQEIIKKPRV